MLGDAYNETRSTLGSLHWLRVSRDGLTFYSINEEVSFNLNRQGQQVLANSHNSPFANQKKAGRKDISSSCQVLFNPNDPGQKMILDASDTGELLYFKSMLEPVAGAFMETFRAIVLNAREAVQDNQIVTLDFDLDVSGLPVRGVVQNADLE